MAAANFSLFTFHYSLYFVSLRHNYYYVISLAMKKLLKVFGCVVAVCLVLMVGTVMVLNTDTFQNKLLKRATSLLSEKLQTRVEIDSVSIGLFSQNVNLYVQP